MKNLLRPRPKAISQPHDIDQAKIKDILGLSRQKAAIKVVKQHDDGDVTVKADNKLFVVTTDHKVFKQIKPGSHRRPIIKSKKLGPVYRNECNGYTVLSRFPLARRRRRRAR